MNDYAALQAAVGAWSFNRTDLPAAELVALGEARLNRDLKLRLAEEDVALTGVPGERLISLPADFVYVVDVWREDSAGRTRLVRMTPGMTTDAAPGTPDRWTIEGGSLAFERPCAAAHAFTLRCGRRFALSEAAPTNWLLTAHPDAYLAAALVEAALWAQDDEQAQRWEARYQAAAQAVRTLDAASRRAPLRTELAGAGLGDGTFDVETGDGLGGGVPLFV
ncbi:MAG TPA: hypothetical protein VEA15_07925 [Caulobacteraceae bacterium]|nr:hypothetical protein [Caulobacteraceae bacterium]